MPRAARITSRSRGFIPTRAYRAYASARRGRTRTRSTYSRPASRSRVVRRRTYTRRRPVVRRRRARR